MTTEAIDALEKAIQIHEDITKTDATGKTNFSMVSALSMVPVDLERT